MLERGTRGWLRGACRALALGAVVLLMIWGRAFHESRKAYYQGEQHFKEKQYIQAVTFFDRSIHWYTPLSPYVEKSAAQLWEISRIAERRGDFALSRIAVSSLRSGFKAAGGFFSPGQEWIGKCEERVEGLLRLEAVQKGLDPDRFQVEKGVPPPSLFWSLVLEIGFLGWVGSVIGLVLFSARKGENRGGSRTIRGFVLWGGLLGLFYAMWIIGMMKA